MSNVPDYRLPADEMMTFKMFTAEKVGIYIREKLSDFPGVAESAKLEYYKTQCDGMILTISSWLVGGKIPSESQHKIVRWPDGAWQTFKELHLPQWFKNKFPVRWHTEDFIMYTAHYFVCPHLVTDPQARHVQFMATGTNYAGYGRMSDHR